MPTYCISVGFCTPVVCLQKRREREIQQQVECRDEETLELKETYSSLQQEVDIKTKKLKKVSMSPHQIMFLLPFI